MQITQMDELDLIDVKGKKMLNSGYYLYNLVLQISPNSIYFSTYEEYMKGPRRLRYRIFNLFSKKELYSTKFYQEALVMHEWHQFTSDSQYLVYASNFDNLCIYDIEQKTLKKTIKHLEIKWISIDNNNNIYILNSNHITKYSLNSDSFQQINTNLMMNKQLIFSSKHIISQLTLFITNWHICIVNIERKKLITSQRKRGLTLKKLHKYFALISDQESTYVEELRIKKLIRKLRCSKEVNISNDEFSLCKIQKIPAETLNHLYLKFDILKGTQKTIIQKLNDKFDNQPCNFKFQDSLILGLSEDKSKLKYFQNE